MNTFTLAVVAIVLLDLLIVEAYFFLIFKIKNPRSQPMIIAVWILFVVMYLGLVLTVQIPLNVLGGAGTDIQRLTAELPVIFATLYTVVLKRNKLRKMRQRFTR